MQPTHLHCQVTYIGHSGFFVEWEACCFLFDYYKGTLPKPKDKTLYVFSSHSHRDHFNPDVFAYGATWPRAIYILSDDIDVPEEEGLEIHRMGPGQKAHFSEALTVETLPSTDLGVAFYVTYRGCSLFHAGDLNDWVWDECTPEENQEMTRLFHAYTEPLKGRCVDIAFLPVDLRQGKDALRGLHRYMRQMKVQHVFPMHFWGAFRRVRRLLEEPECMLYAPFVILLNRNGDTYELQDDSRKLQRF